MSTHPTLGHQSVTIPALKERKARGERIVALTAYDNTSARLGEESGADVLLVGDSLGMVVQGHGDTLRVTLDQMVYHCSIVSRVCHRALVVADMPFLSFHTGFGDAVRNAGRCLQEGGVQGVKIEGGRKRARLVNHLVENEIPVMGHIGLTPQSVHGLGGFKVQGRTVTRAQELLEDATALEEAGAFAVVLECIPSEVAAEITRSLAIPTIGIGAGPHCDGQILVFHDLLGLYGERTPRFVRRYGEFGKAMGEALRSYGADVRSGGFPSETECFHLEGEARETFEERARKGLSRG
jgi:3-methyl-2-oxobutanoate hydroxymethyltransferase